MKLHRFWVYWHTASQTSFAVSPRTAGPISPAPLPSPPSSQTASSSYVSSAHSPTRAYYQPNSQANTDHSASLPSVDLSMVGRKRSYDVGGGFVMEPPAKRVTRSMAPNISVTIPQFPMQIPPPVTTPTRYTQRESSPQASTACSVASLTIPSIPPMSYGLTLPEPGNRSMSMVFSNQAQLGVPSAAPISAQGLISIPPVGPQSRNSSPFLQPTSNNSSPSSAYQSQQPQHLSPSYFLGNRSSPYRPVRGVTTLLIPQSQAPAPPPMSLDQIQYQPLAKARQYRNGVLPYLQTEVAWGPSTHRPSS